LETISKLANEIIFRSNHKGVLFVFPGEEKKWVELPKEIESDLTMDGLEESLI